MSLSDLKRKSTRCKPERVNHGPHHSAVDEFINNAHHYANGSPQGGCDNVISIATGRPGLTTSVQQPYPTEVFDGVKGIKGLADDAKKQPYRKATFTLSEQCIESLTLLSQQTGCSKSHLIRMLIDRTK